MKREENYWVDHNKNKWNCASYSEDKAIELSKTLVNCHSCMDCSACSYCISCHSCRDCSACRSCSVCISCSYCSYCRSFKENPQRYVTKKIGSRAGQTTIYWVGKEIQIICGCFKGDLEKFEKAVEETHGDTNYGKQYKKEIAIFKMLVKEE